jgi:DNA replication protein DnaC
MTESSSRIPPRLAALMGLIGNPPAGLEPDDTIEAPPASLDGNAVTAWNRQRGLDWFAGHVPPRFRTATAEHPKVKEWVNLYLLDPNFGSMMLQGLVGTGKTHNAFGAVRAIADSGIPPIKWQHTTAADLYRRLRPNDRNDQDAILTKLCETPLLILDDLGAVRTSPFVEEVTYQLIDARYWACLPTIVTTNLPTDPTDPNGNRIHCLADAVGGRTYSRLVEMCSTWVIFDGPDLRRAA